MKRKLSHNFLNLALMLALVFAMIPLGGLKASAAGSIEITGFTAPEVGDSCSAPSLSVTVGAESMNKVSSSWQDSNGTALSASSKFEYGKTYTLTINVHNLDEEEQYIYDFSSSETAYPVIGLTGMENVKVSTTGAPSYGLYGGMCITADITFPDNPVTMKTSTFKASSENTTLSETLYTGTAGTEWVISIKNDTDVNLDAVAFKIYYSVYSNGNLSNQKFWIQSGKDCMKDDTNTLKSDLSSKNALEYYLIEIAAGETEELHIFYQGINTTDYMQCYVECTASMAKTYVESKSDIKLNTSYDTEATTGSYFYFHLDKPAKVTVQTKSSGFYNYEIHNCSGGSVSLKSGDIESTETVNKTYKLRAGDFYLQTYNKNSLNFRLTKEDFAWGTMKIKISGKKITASYTDHDSADSSDSTATCISEWTVGNPYVYQHEYLTGSKKSCTGTIDTSALTKPGWYVVTFTVTNTNYSGITKKYTANYFKSPQKPGSFNLVSVGTTSVTTGDLGSYDNGDHIQVQLYKNGKWTNSKVVVSGKSAKITGLKQNTAYKIRIKGLVRKSGYKDMLTAASKVISFRTGTTSKPSIKSIKISGAKYIYHAGKAAGGYWDANGHWTRTAAQKAYYSTSFKVTITLSKRVKGPAGLWVNGSYKKGSGKTFTFTLSANGKVKGKKTLLQIRYANNAKWGGLSPVTKQYATVK